jgi:hypothetical protein
MGYSLGSFVDKGVAEGERKRNADLVKTKITPFFLRFHWDKEHREWNDLVELNWPGP